MKNVLSRFSAVCVAMLLFVVVRQELNAQPAPETSSNRPASPEDLSQAELLKAYLQLREQLHATQLAIVSNRAEADAAARAQAAALTERMEAIKSAIEAERVRQQVEQERQADRERQQAETQRSTRTMLWVAAAFAGVGLLTTLLMPLLQFRAINRMTALATVRPEIPTPSPHALLHAEAALPSDQPVAASNQRLLSVIDRMERRIMDLEHTATSPSPAPAVRPPNPSPAPASLPMSNALAARVATDDSTRRAVAANDQAAWIAVLMNKARSSLSANKALDAVVCYEEILRLDRSHTEALVKKGAALERLNRYEEAIECYERAIAMDRRMMLAYLHKGAACHRVGRYEEAVECFEEALRVEQAEQRPQFASEGAAAQGDVARDPQLEAAGTTAGTLAPAGPPRARTVTTLR